MFLDRSMAAMTAIVCLMAIIAVSLAIAGFQTYRTQKTDIGRFSTSVGGNTEQCHSVNSKSTIIHIFINIGATIILGVSNTYQQLATGLSANELRKALEIGGAVTVGTNSPFSMRHKQTGKVAAYLSWAFLFATSLPVHLLANSAIGPSFVLRPRGR
jgi:ABC-type xylose transport system permease subunit